MDLTSQLEQVFATNFEVYYRTHVAHVNTVGRNFYSDHKLLQGIYEGLQDNIDTLAEFLRTLRVMMPNSLNTIIELSATADNAVTGTSEELLQGVYDDLEIMIDQYLDLNTVADEAGHPELANFAQDQLRLLRRSCWQLRSILEDEAEELYEKNERN
jgi:starvation-inducible DNA-binding protein